MSERAGSVKGLLLDQLPIERALGVRWDVETDTFGEQLAELVRQPNGLVLRWDRLEAVVDVEVVFDGVNRLLAELLLVVLCSSPKTEVSTAW